MRFRDDTKASQIIEIEIEFEFEIEFEIEFEFEFEFEIEFELQQLIFQGIIQGKNNPVVYSYFEYTTETNHSY